MPDDILTAVDAAQREHFFRTSTTCACGFAPPSTRDWHQHLAAVAAAAVATWLRSRSSPTLIGDPFTLAADWAAGAIEESVRG